MSTQDTSQDPEPREEQAGLADVPTPPGGPQRGDRPGDTANVSAEQLQEDLQRENAATSLDQPSDASGGE